MIRRNRAVVTGGVLLCTCLIASFAMANDTVKLKENALSSPAAVLELESFYAAQTAKLEQSRNPLNLARAGGEDCASATVIPALPYNDTGDTTGAVDDYDESSGGACPSASTAGDLVYSYTPAADEVINIDLCNGSGYDTKLIVFENACSNGSAYACDDDACGSAGGFQSQLLNLQVFAGNTYYIVVDGWDGDEGAYNLDVFLTPVGACCGTSGCTEVTEADCLAGGGTYIGDGTTCSPIDPCAVGACCLSDGSCTEGDQASCDTAGGVYQGDASTCAGTSCPQPCICTNAVTTFPYVENFEGEQPGCIASGSFVSGAQSCPLNSLWQNEANGVVDDTDFLSQFGGTGSGSTGPSVDVDPGNAQGIYLYVEGSSANNLVAELRSPCLDVTGLAVPRLQFSYHNWLNGLAGTIDVDVSTDNCISWTNVFSTNADTGDNWVTQVVGLPTASNLRIRFVVTQCDGSVFCFPDPAIDALIVFDGAGATGACCDGTTCTEGVSEMDCVNGGGSYLGDFTTCGVPNPCAGACCTDSGATCNDLDEASCLGGGGIYLGGGTSCATSVCPTPGDTCADPLLINVPGDLGYINSNSTCGRVDDYESTCMGSYDGGEDIIYELNVTQDTCVNVEILSDTIWDGIAIDTACPLSSGSCVATATTSVTPNVIENLLLSAGTYYLMADTFPAPECMDFVLTITECPVGACCSNGVCSELTQAECDLNGGTYVGDGTDCLGDPCNEGACCQLDGSCSVTDSNGCVLAGGTYLGDATSCSPNECPQPGDDCTNPIPVTVPADLGYVNTNSTCGRGDAYEDTCMGFYDGGDDIIYELTVTDTTCVDISILSDTIWDGIGIDTACPLDGTTCLATATTSSTPDTIEKLLLDPGTYYLMADTFPSPQCMDFVMSIAACPTGACCSNGLCTELSEPECAAIGGVYAGDNTVCAGDDCNNNGSDDACEILENPSVDCNGNDVPDDCDLSGGTSGDCNNNSIPDECEADCNNNGVADECDVAGGTSEDCQPDGVPDECQLGGARGTVVADGGFEGGTPNASWTEASVAFGTPLCDVPSCGTGTGTGPFAGDWWCWFGGTAAGDIGSVEQVVTMPAGSAELSFQMEMIICDSASDFMEVLIDGTQVYLVDGSSPLCGNLGYTLQTVDVSAFADGGSHTLTFRSETFGANGGGSNIFVDDVAITGGAGNAGDCNNNGIPDDCDIAAGTADDCDTNGVPDSCEFLDCDGNGTHDPCDILQGADDCNNDNIPDKCQTDDNDCNGNGVPDDCDLVTDPDCNNNGILDFCDIDAGTSEDCQPDTIPDECQLGTGGSGDVVADGGFEGATPNADWNEASVAFGTPLCDVPGCGTGTGTGPFAGAWWCWFGGTAAGDVASVDQDVTIGTGTAELTFQLEAIICDSPSDFMEVLIDGTQVYVVDGSSPLCGNLGYTLQTVDVSAFADGGVHNLEFRSETLAINGGGSNFFVDDIALVVTGATSNDCNGNGIPDDCDNCADLDGDLDVDSVDYQLFRDTFGKVSGDAAYNECADYDDSGAVGLADYQQWLSCYRDFVNNPFAAPPVRQGDANDVGFRPGVRPTPRDSLTPR
jgi:hypothetical protein